MVNELNQDVKLYKHNNGGKKNEKKNEEKVIW
jgi:hypothetical protein